MTKAPILFVAEAVSLAHVARPLALAHALDPERYEIHFACHPQHERLVSAAPHVKFWPIGSISSRDFLVYAAANDGESPWDRQNVREHFAEDVALLEKLRPALVVSDYRLTMPISAKASRTRHAALVSVQWSPFREFEVKDYPRFPPLPLSWRLRERFKKLIRPPGERTSADIFNKLRRGHGLAPVAAPYMQATEGDYVLYTDPEGFIPTKPLPPNHRFLGPILWSPATPKPAWWETWDKSRPTIYLNLGSTGAATQLPAFVQELADLPANLVVGTAGRVSLAEVPNNVYVADFIPGIEMSKLASVVVCNGGCGTSYQALNAGVPVVGLWSNIDQFFTMKAIERQGVGIAYRAGEAEPKRVKALVSQVLGDAAGRAKAAEIGVTFRAYDALARFRAFIEALPLA